MFACLPDIISNFGLTCTDTSERRNTLRFVSAAASEYPSFRFRYASTAEACTAGFLLYVKKRAFCRQGRRTGGMPFALFPPRKRDGGLRCGIPPLRQKAGFLTGGPTDGGMARGFVPTIERRVFRLKGAVPKWTPRAASDAEGNGGYGDAIPPLRQKAGFLPPGTKDGGNGAGFRPQDRKTHLSIERSRPEMDAPRCKRRGREWRVRDAI